MREESNVFSGVGESADARWFGAVSDVLEGHRFFKIIGLKP